MRKTNSQIKIKPLSRNTLAKALKVLRKAFPQNIPYFTNCLEVSLQKNGSYLKFLAKEGLIGIPKYFVALDKNDVAGVIGIYSMTKDRQEANWVGWFAVDPEYRKQGIGTKLMNFIICKAKNNKKKYLRLYSSTYPLERYSHKFYEKKGFVKMGEQRIRKNSHNKYYFYELKV